MIPVAERELMMTSSSEPSPASELTVESLSDYQAFLDLEPVWNALVEEAGIDHPFLTHEWVRTWWECFGAANELHILVVKANREPIAIAPLRRSRGRIYGVKVRQLESIHNDHTPRFDFIVGSRGEETYRALWNYLLRHRTAWDVLKLCQLPAGSRTLDELPRLAAQEGFLVGLWRSANSPYVPLRGGSWDSYVKTLNQKHRSNLRNRLKRLSHHGQMELEGVSSDGEVASALDEGLRIEAAAWKGEAGTAINSQPEVRAFYTRLALRAAESGKLRLHFLNVGGHRIAFHYSLVHQNKLYLLKPGYDPQYAPYSPCNLLCWLVLGDAFDRGIAEFDFLGVDDTWKLEWTRDTRPHYWLFLFPPALRARLVHYAKFRVAPRVKRGPFYAVSCEVISWLRRKFRIPPLLYRAPRHSNAKRRQGSQTR